MNGQAAQLVSDALCGALDAIGPIQKYAAVKLEEDQLDLYAQELADIPADQLRLGVRHYLRTAQDRFWPTIRRIRESVDAAIGVRPEGWESAYTRIMESARTWSRFDADLSMQAWSNLTAAEQEAVRFLGGFDTIGTTDLGILRAHFRDWWNSQVKQQATKRALERRPIGVIAIDEVATKFGIGGPSRGEADRTEQQAKLKEYRDERGNKNH